jgi:hypothetical protein
MDSLIDIVVLAGLCVFLISWIWRRTRGKQAKNWPAIDAEIQTGAFEVLANSRYGQIELPVFAFSYQVGSRYYGGRFALRPYITDPGPSVVERMTGRKLQVRYNPQKPQEWFIADEYIEGCEVEQKFSTHLVNYEPRT